MPTPPIGRRRELLARAEELVTRRRQAEVDDLLTVLAWADTHDGDPQSEPAPAPLGFGGPRLVQVGGAGTPEVVDLCFAEIAIARQAGEVATRNLTADALDLRHRLPALWAQVQDLACEAWVARKIARMSRPLSRDVVRVVDDAVADAIGQSPARLLTIAEAKVVEADQVAHDARVETNRRRKGVWFPTPRPGELIDDDSGAAGVRTVFGRLDEADAVDLEQAVDDLADILADRADYPSDNEPTRDQLRADSLGLLARPADALALLRGDDEASTDEPPNVADKAAGDPAPRARQRRLARLVVHLSDLTLFGVTGGIARVEDLGPMLLDQIADLLRHRDIEVLPVIDLRETRAVNGYEHPADMRARTMIRTGGDVFPHSAARPEARVDHDHAVAYDPTGPPGQTGDHNDAPLTRRHHRAKTHLGYRVTQLAPGAYRWCSPGGLGRVVTPRGTRRVDLLTTDSGRIFGEVYPPPTGTTPRECDGATRC